MRTGVSARFHSLTIYRICKPGKDSLRVYTIGLPFGHHAECIADGFEHRVIKQRGINKMLSVARLKQKLSVGKVTQEGH
jgi:hypothetical protein